MKLSDRIITTDNHLINTVTHKALPVLSNYDELRRHHFMVDQELDAIRARLYKPPQIVHLKIIPTWQCNLRCTHCFVLHKLKRIDQEPHQEMNHNKIINWIDRYLERYKVKQLIITFLGGEPTIKAKWCSDLLQHLELTDFKTKHNVQIITSMTTNGTINNNNVLKLCQLLTNVMFSVDGDRFVHDKQRVKYCGLLPVLSEIDGSPYDKTCETIKELINAGLKNKIGVQATFASENWNKLNIENYLRGMLKIGLDPNQLIQGLAIPTTRKPKYSDLQIIASAQKIWTHPCCKWRWMSDFTICDHQLSNDYFKDGYVLGSLDDDLETIEKSHKALIEGEMPAFNDPKCIACPSLGVCWGRCDNESSVGKPSDICDQKWYADVLSKRDGSVQQLFKVKE